MTIIFNTGSVPVIPDVTGEYSSRVIDSTVAQHLVTTLYSLVIVGGGAISMEFATMVAQFGTKVTILDRGEKFGTAFDEDVAAEVKADLEAKDITIINSADVTGLKDTDDGIKVRYCVDDGEH